MATSDEDGKTARFDSMAQKMGEGGGRSGCDSGTKKKARPAFPQRKRETLQSFPFRSLTRGMERLDNCDAHLPYVETEAQEGKELSRALCRELQSQGGEQRLRPGAGSSEAVTMAGT